MILKEIIEFEKNSNQPLPRNRFRRTKRGANHGSFSAIKDKKNDPPQFN
jgi:hypothetical protein